MVRVAVHPDLTRMGYGSRALQILTHYYQGDIKPLKPLSTEASKDAAKAAAKAAKAAAKVCRKPVPVQN